MTWFRLDDKSAFHRKIMDAGNEAWGALCRAGAWSSERLTDGRVPWSVALTIGPRRLWDRLASVGLVDPDGEHGISLHDFLDWNPSAEEVKALRTARQDAGKIGGLRKASNRLATAKQVSGKPVAKIYPDPDPDPVPKREREAPARKKTERGARIVDDWAPAAELAAELTAKHGLRPPELAAVVERFRNHFLAASGQVAVKRNWGAAFRNWVAGDVERGKIGGHFPKPPAEPPSDEAPAAWYPKGSPPADVGPQQALALIDAVRGPR